MKETLPALDFQKKMKFFYSITLGVFLTLGCVYGSFAQTTGSVGIGTTAPDASAVLDITSTTKGVLVPRLTTVQRDAVATPQNGLLIYNSSDLKFNYWNGAKWEEVGGGITWFSGQGQPAGLDNAKLNDLYLNEQTGDIYQRVMSSFPPAVLTWVRFNFQNNSKKQLPGASLNIGANSSQSLTFPFAGAGTTNAVVCSPMFDLAPGIVIAQAWVSAAGVITVKFRNTNSSVAVLNAGNYQLAIF